jgi:diaminopimelate epimerase
MTQTISFTKASGAGNDFVLIDNMQGLLRADYSALARAVCDRHFGVGADGLLVAEPSTTADFRMLYFNADGSYGGMCGNGGRCLARFAFERGIAGAAQRFEALGHTYDAVIGEDSVRLHMKDPEGFAPHPALQTAGRTREAWFLNTGAPHVVLLVTGLDMTDVRTEGKAVRDHPAFAPGGTNANFMMRDDAGEISLRTYERGVEDETLACGTGSVASALVASLLYGLPSPVRVRVRSGETLTVHFAGRAGAWHDINLEGSARMLFRGTFAYDSDSHMIGQAP